MACQAMVPVTSISVTGTAVGRPDLTEPIAVCGLLGVAMGLQGGSSATESDAHILNCHQKSGAGC